MAGTTFVLVPGYWLGGWAWDPVAATLRAAGHGVDALTLPGLAAAGLDRSAVRLDDHVAAVAAAVAAAGGEVVLVAHSGAGKVVSAVLDADPTAVRRVVYVDSGPAADGLADPLPPEVVELPLPPWDELAGSVEGLTDEQLDTFRRRAVPHPAAVAREPVRLRDPARHAVPTTLVACSIPPATVVELAAAGHPMFAAVAELEDLTCAALPTGHWPMWSRPDDLAALLLAAADQPAAAAVGPGGGPASRGAAGG